MASMRARALAATGGKAPAPVIPITGGGPAIVPGGEREDRWDYSVKPVTGNHDPYPNPNLTITLTLPYTNPKLT
jgi:hypothetical protein